MKKLIIALILTAFIIGLLLLPSNTPISAQGGYAYGAEQVKWWDSLSEVRTYVKAQPTYFAKYIPDVYDCDNFALDLWRQSLQEQPQRLIGIREVIKENNHQVYYHHIQNFTLLGNPYERNTPIIVIEARTGQVYYLGDEYQIRLDR